MNDRALWLMIRRALLMVVRAIEKRYNIGEHESSLPQLVDDVLKLEQK